MTSSNLMNTTPPAWTIVEPEDAYHAMSKSGYAMASGMLRRFRECPFAYHQLITGQTADKDTSAFRFGRAVHTIVLEGIEAFNKRYAIGGPVNPRTGKSFGVGTKAHDEWLVENGYDRSQIINDDEADALVKMANMVRRHENAAALLDFGWSERVVRTVYQDVVCQIRIDWLTVDQGGNHVIVDLKTTSNLDTFLSDAALYDYPSQFAFYRDVFSHAGGIPCHVMVIAIEKKEPFRVGVWRMPEEILDLHSAENKRALAWYRECHEKNEWPTMYEQIREFSERRNTA